MPEHEAFKDNSVRAKVAIGFLAAAAITDFLTALAGLYQVSLVGRIETGFLTEAELDAGNVIYGAVGGLQSLLYLATAIPFLMWFYRAHANLPALGEAVLKYSPGWAVGGFFVPILNLIRPYHVAEEVWQCSSPPPPEGEKRVAPRGVTVAGGWWLLFIIMNLLGLLGGRMVDAAWEPAALQRALYVIVSGDVLSVFCALIAIRMIRGIQRMQLARSHPEATHGAMDPATV